MGASSFARRWRLPLLLLCLTAGVLSALIWWRGEGPSSRWARSVKDVPEDDSARRPRLVRGPYIQRATPKSAVIRWRTNVPARATIVCSGTQGDLHRQSSAEATTEHEFELTGLQAGTRYSYSLALDDREVASSPDAWTFRTHPVDGEEDEPVRIWALGDSGTASPSARAVRDAYLKFAGGKLPDLWLMLGDNAYVRGTDAEYQVAVFDTYAELLSRLCLWPTRGNHDKDGLFGLAPYYDVFTLPTRGEAGGVPSGTEAYFAIDYGFVHLISLDSYGSDRSASGAMVEWLKQDLRGDGARWTIAFFHHPPYTRGTHDSDRERQMIEMRQNVLPVLEAGNVDLVLSGHSHDYERSGLLKGHFGKSETFRAAHKLASGAAGVVFHKSGPTAKGTVYVVAGASGELGRRFGSLDHPVMDVSSPTLGSLSIEVTSTSLSVRYITDEAKVLDQFSLVKP